MDLSFDSMNHGNILPEGLEYKGFLHILHFLY
uniref:Uncharacterized protein n=1 Tax=Rhizophora mucronata TaxID=61149 RepID=A0A2P2NMH3_RHIMU